MPKSCYMCEQTATSKEHVPPQCFFPEEKDLTAGINLRKNLITVPSCDDHNTNKSKDDEYLLFCLSLNIANNDTAFSHFATKITRAMSLNPKTYDSFTKTNMPVVAVDNETGVASHTYMIKLDTSRIMTSLDQISRALYFKQYKRRFEGNCKILYDFALYNGPDATKKNDFLQNALKQMKDYFDKMKHAGENPEVFRYVLQDVDKGHFLGMRFYGGSNVFVAFVS
ncbi:MAG: hypothetical protein WC769_01365 [Thermodesulfovibrionales bacterium]